MEPINHPVCGDCFYYDEPPDSSWKDCMLKPLHHNQMPTKKPDGWCGQWRDKEPPYWTLDDRFNNNQYVYTKDLEQKLRGDVT